MSEQWAWCLGVEWFSCLQPTVPSSVFCAHTGSHEEGISSSTAFIIIIVTLGMALITAALCELQALQKKLEETGQSEQNKDKEGQFADI